MSKFAKIFESETYGQICVIVQGNSKNLPEVRAFVLPEGFGVCSIALSYYSEDDWGKADAFFEGLDLKGAEAMVKPVFEAVKGNL